MALQDRQNLEPHKNKLSARMVADTRCVARKAGKIN